MRKTLWSCAFVATVLLASCSNRMGLPSAPAFVRPHAEAASRWIVREEGGSLAVSNGTGVIIPPDALSQSATVTVSELSPAAAPPAGFGLAVAGPVYSFDSGPASFIQGVTIEIHYRDADIPASHGADELRVVTYLDGTWSAVPAAWDTAENKLTAVTGHFSPWAVGVTAVGPTLVATWMPTPTPVWSVAPTRTPENTATPLPSGTAVVYPPVLVPTRTPTPVPGAPQPTRTPDDTPTPSPTGTAPVPTIAS